ncbi:Gti1/Pac2 family-domain-containing protein [Bisporella sp. PMI_857]|nr:Gti1/Pac2 family-domain-containing protein [Bisporella sp. PMI_857]
METYRGHLRTPADAIKLFEACRLGLLPRLQRRLSQKERQSISSGSVFVWDEREAGMRRWTDGGEFAPPSVRRSQGKTPESGRGSDEDRDMDGEEPDRHKYKPDGLMKQSFSITTSNRQHLHLISYYSRPHANAPDLPRPTTDPQLRHIVPVKGMYPEATVHKSSGPAVTRTPTQSPEGPPPLSDSSIPPPPLSQRPMSTEIAAQLAAQHQPNPSPHFVQAHIAPPLDPRLPQSAPNAPRAHAPQSHSGVPPPSTPQANGNISQAQSIPSILALVHAENSTSVMTDNKNNSRTGSKNPEGKATDVPHEKLHHASEDQRAVRVLDPKF